MRAIILLLALCSFICEAQVNLNGKSLRLVGADSTQGTLNGTIYYSVNGFRFRQNNTWYKLPTTYVNLSSFSATSPLSYNSGTGAFSTSMSTSRILGRVTAGTGVVEQLTGTQATTLLDAFSSSLKGLAPASGGGTSNFLRADGSWAVPPGLGTIGGSISATQVAYGSGSNTITGESAFTYDAATNKLTSDGLNVTSISDISSSGISMISSGFGIVSTNNTNTSVISGNDSFLLSFQDNVQLTSGSGILQISASSSYIDLSAQTDLNFLSGGSGTPRLKIASNGSWQLAGSAGTSGQALVSNGSGSAPTWQTVSASPAGSNTQVQYNNSGAFGAEAAFAYNSTTDILTVGSGNTIGGVGSLQLASSGGIFSLDKHQFSSAGAGDDAPMNVGQVASDPTLSLNNGDKWYNSTSHLYKGRVNGSTVNFITGTLTSGRVTFSNGSGSLSDDSDMTFSGSTLTVTDVSSGTLSITQGAIISGTYTPTLTAITNVSSSSVPGPSYYIRVGNVVTVSGQLQIDPTAGNTGTQLTLTLPVASNFINNGYASGSITSTGTINYAQGHIEADFTGDTLQLNFESDAAHTNRAYYYIAQYRIN